MRLNEGSSAGHADGGSRPETAGHTDAAEVNAPTAEEENEGMNTVLDANPLTGVQPEAGDR